MNNVNRVIRELIDLTDSIHARILIEEEGIKEALQEGLEVIEISIPVFIEFLKAIMVRVSAIKTFVEASEGRLKKNLADIKIEDL